MRKISRSAAHLGPPPAHPDQQEAPITKELRLFVLKGMPDKLQNPAKNKESCGVRPERVKEDRHNKHCNGEHDQRNAKTMAKPVYWMSVAACVLCDPLLAAASA